MKIIKFILKTKKGAVYSLFNLRIILLVNVINNLFGLDFYEFNNKYKNINIKLNIR